MKTKSSNSKKLTLEKFEISRLNSTRIIGGNGDFYSDGCGDAGGNSGCNSGCGGTTITQPTRQDQIFTMNGGY